MRLKNFSLQYGLPLYKAFSDEARVRILHLIVHWERMCVSDLELTLDFTQTKTSRHVTYLKNAGLVYAKKIDQWVFYSVKEEVQDFVNQMFSYLAKDAQLQKDLEISQILHSNRELALNKIGRGWTP
ncbi:MAG: metalloregulator ArsR/SmtB family transcription factor [Bacteroidota bacterium]